MAKKKQPQLSTSQEENAQVQAILEHYHEIAKNLQTSTDQKQAESALTEINNIPEAAQMALLKALSNEHHTDAADVLTAMHELSPIKNVRKEAKRSLIRLEGARIYPEWTVPLDRTPFTEVEDTPNPPRFWKGLVTDSLESGEAQLTLCWEQGNDYRDVRIMGFLLDFWMDGVKDFFTRIESKRSVDTFIDRMSREMPEVKIRDCSLAEARRLLLNALEANKKHGTVPHKDYRYHLSLVNRLLVEAPGIEEEEAGIDEEDEDRPDLHGLDPISVVVNFVEAWVGENYDLAYDLLSSDSSIREGLSKEEWIERREAWAEEAEPDELEPNFIYEREPQKSGLWLPFSAGRSANRKEVEVGWSIEMTETSLTLPELPTATAVYEETDRHWFWATYTLVQDQDEWRIQSMTDEATHAQSLPIAELQKRIQECDTYVDDFSKKYNVSDLQRLAEEEAQRYAEQIFRHVMQANSYTDALLKKMPLDRTLYEEAVGRMIVFNQLERSLVYLEPLTQRFVENRAVFLTRLAEVYRLLSSKYLDIEDEERAERFEERAEETLKEALTIGESMDAHISLAELLIDENERLDEARDHLLKAKALATDPGDEAHIEIHLGEIATAEEEYEEALHHYQRVVELEPTNTEAWINLGESHQKLKHIEEAETSYKRAIELEPDNEDSYYTLSRLYVENGQPEKGIDVLEEAVVANPDSALLNAYLASTYLENGDYRQAEIFLEKAEEIAPDLQIVKLMRSILTLSKARNTGNVSKLSRPKKKKKR